MSSARADLIIRGGWVVSASDVHEASVAIRSEKIVAVGPDEFMPASDTSIDARGKYVLPGAIDCHVHLGRLDDYRIGGLAAAQAGVTTIMPFGVYDHEQRETLPQAIARLNNVIEQDSVVDVAWHLRLLADPEVLEGLPAALELGVTSFKMFMTYKRQPHWMASDGFICRVMNIVRAGGGLVQLHCENGEAIEYLEERLIAEGRIRPRDFPDACPEWVEEEAINRAINLARVTGCPLYVVHLSTESGLERIKQAQAEGQTVWTETCPQYLLLSDADLEQWGPLAKIGPPLRPAGGPNQEALWRGLADGYISCLGSDHAPWPQEAKSPGWENIFVGPNGAPIPFGSPGIETLVPLAYSEGVAKRGLPIWWLARVLAENPARIFGVYPRKGVIHPGSDADLLILDPDARHTIRAADHLSRTAYTLFEGREVQGWPWMTLLRGKVLLDQGKLAQEPGYGRVIRAGSPLPPIAGSVRRTHQP